MHRFHGVQHKVDEEMYVVITKKHVVVQQWATDCEWENVTKIERTSRTVHAAVRWLRQCENVYVPAKGTYNIPGVHEDEYVDEDIAKMPESTRVDIFRYLR